VSADASHPATGRRLYIDTSAYLCMLLGEEGSLALLREAAGANLLSSVLLVLEAGRSLVRLAREGAMTAARYEACQNRLRQDREVFTLRDVTLDLCESGPLPAVMTPRSLDLVHLRTALWFHAGTPLTRFITMDGVQAQAARELGLPV
jgi:hypothetical protein